MTDFADAWIEATWRERKQAVILGAKLSPVIAFLLLFRALLFLLGEVDDIWPSTENADKTERKS